MKKLIAISLASLILLSYIGFTFANHFCGEHAVDSELSFWVHHLDCGMPTMYVQEILDSHGLWPIPYSEVEANKDVFRAQNPGY